MSTTHYIILFLIGVLIYPSAAQTCNSTSITTSNATCPCPDVILDVPNLSVGEISLTVNKLEAHVSLNAKLANLVSLNAGVDVVIDKVNLTIKEVEAEVHLVVRLDKVAAILERALDTLDRNPNILSDLVESISGLLSSTVNSAGQVVQRFVESTGDLVERVLNSSGDVIQQSIVGNVKNLPVVSTTTNSLGQIVKVVRDTSGNMIELIYSGTTLLGTRVLN